MFSPGRSEVGTSTQKKGFVQEHFIRSDVFLLLASVYLHEPIAHYNVDYKIGFIVIL